MTRVPISQAKPMGKDDASGYVKADIDGDAAEEHEGRRHRAAPQRFLHGLY
jgi:hypothetical protein